MKIILQKLGANMDSAVLTRWIKSEGDPVKKDEIIAEVETDKVSQEIVAPEDGFLIKQYFQEDDDVPVGAAIAEIDSEISANAEYRNESVAKHEEDPRPQNIGVYSLSRAEKISGERMLHSLQSTAQITLTREADVTDAITLLDDLKKNGNSRITFTAMVIHALSKALQIHQRFNGKLEDGEIKIPSSVDVNVAVATDRGLVVPVIRDVQDKSLVEIAEKLNDVAKKARDFKLDADDFETGSFTLTNLGTSGVDAFTPILNPGQIGILGVGRTLKRPWVYQGKIEIRSIVTLSLTWDHQAVDGYPAAQFVQTIVENLETSA